MALFVPPLMGPMITSSEARRSLSYALSCNGRSGTLRPRSNRFPHGRAPALPWNTCSTSRFRAGTSCRDASRSRTGGSARGRGRRGCRPPPRPPTSSSGQRECHSGLHPIALRIGEGPARPSGRLLCSRCSRRRPTRTDNSRRECETCDPRRWACSGRGSSEISSRCPPGSRCRRQLQPPSQHSCAASACSSTATPPSFPERRGRADRCTPSSRTAGLSSIPWESQSQYP
mmetsp:Transcript_5892/g.11884  ORF Transcript_5892/g.11884 Transcript_5892/m.11884 type:complete len:230 (+) Transcript_5892:50-739(+)